MFDLAILRRFDLNYLRPLQSDEVHSVTQFLRTSQEEIRRKRINAKLECSLKSANFKNCNYLLVEDCFEELESKLVEQYISYFVKLLPF